MAYSASKTPTVAILTTAVFLLIGAAQMQSNQEPTEHSFSVDSDDSLIIESDSESIDVESHNRNTVKVMVTKRAATMIVFK